MAEQKKSVKTATAKSTAKSAKGAKSPQDASVPARRVKKNAEKSTEAAPSREALRYGRGERESRGKASMVRVSARKLNDVARTIRLKPVDRALQELRFSKQRIAVVVSKLLRSVVANAENNKQLDIDRLVVKEAWVGKARRMRRFRPRARGRAAPIIKDFSMITIVVEEREEG